MQTNCCYAVRAILGEPTRNCTACAYMYKSKHTCVHIIRVMLGTRVAMTNRRIGLCVCEDDGDMIRVCRSGDHCAIPFNGMSV
eukprot:5381461-Pyramimonas_sp.AAC.1